MAFRVNFIILSVFYCPAQFARDVEHQLILFTVHLWCISRGNPFGNPILVYIHI